MADKFRTIDVRRLAGAAGMLVAGALALLAATVPAAPGSGAAAASLSPALQLAKGKLVVARRGLPDPNFTQTVVLLLEYGDEGAMGLVVNRPTEMKLSHLWPESERIAERPDTLWIGGPVAQSAMMMLVRGEESEDSQPVLEDISVSGSREWLEKLAATGIPASRLRVYSGYAGWGPGQLEWEVGRGDWLIWPADGETIFSDRPQEVWDQLIRHSSDLLARLRSDHPGRNQEAGGKPALPAGFAPTSSEDDVRSAGV